MNGKRPKKRFNAKEEIEREIDAIHLKITTDSVLAERMDRDAVEFVRQLSQLPTRTEEDREKYHAVRAQLNEARKVAFEARRHVGTLRNKLTPLKRKLAEFETLPMPFLQDGSVVAP